LLKTPPPQKKTRKEREKKQRRGLCPFSFSAERTATFEADEINPDDLTSYYCVVPQVEPAHPRLKKSIETGQDVPNIINLA